MISEMRTPGRLKAQLIPSATVWGNPTFVRTPFLSHPFVLQGRAGQFLSMTDEPVTA